MKGTITRNDRINDKYYRMDIECAEFASKAKIGQFLMLKTGHQDYLSDPMLRRPFGVADVKGDVFSVVYMIVGKGTKLLTESKPGSEIEFSEPLGNGFTLYKNQKIALAAGGIGIAPLLLYSKVLKDNGCDVHLYYGGRSIEDIVLTGEFKPFLEGLTVTTDDGSSGFKGLVTEPLEKELDKYDRVIACGPKGMMRAVSGICKNAGKPIEVSLDERMACGLGACLGCIIYVEQNGQTVQKRCCVEGPVFDGSIIVWDSVCR